MTVRDLRMEYHRDTGKYAPMVHDEHIRDGATESEYIEWLEQHILTLQKPLVKGKGILLSEMSDEELFNKRKDKP